MTMSPIEAPQVQRRTRGLRRTVWILAVIAVCIYAAFIASGVIASLGGAG